jgi:magnesium-transporting ATPase (P-type)
VLNLFFVAAWIFLGLSSLVKALKHVVSSLPNKTRFVWIGLLVAALLCFVVSFIPAARTYPAGPWGQTICLIASATVALAVLVAAGADARKRW